MCKVFKTNRQHARLPIHALQPIQVATEAPLMEAVPPEVSAAAHIAVADREEAVAALAEVHMAAEAEAADADNFINSNDNNS